jgi:hypothetical protein
MLVVGLALFVASDRLWLQTAFSRLDLVSDSSFALNMMSRLKMS